MDAPSTNGGKRGPDRGANGRFAPGNAGGPGNPFARQTGELRAALHAAVRPEDIAAIVEALVRQAKAGDVRAIRELLDRVIGRPIEADLLERLTRLEELAVKIEAQEARR